MSDEVIAVSKAVEKTAEFGTTTVKASEKLGAFVVRVFKEPLDQVSGMLTDRLKFERWKRMVAIADRVDEIIAERGIPYDATRAIPPKLALPIFESASLEEDETLQELWVQLLANAMDPRLSVDLQIAFIEIAKNLRPCEAKLLAKMYRTLELNGAASLHRAPDFGFSKTDLGFAPTVFSEEYLVSIDNLKRLQCVQQLEKNLKFGNGFNIRSTQRLVVQDDQKVVMTVLGLRFVQASIASNKPRALTAEPDPEPRFKSSVNIETEITKDSFRAADL